MKLFCLIVGVKGNAFSVSASADDTIGDLKKLIKSEKPNDFGHADADTLDLYLARKDGAWLSEDDDAELQRLSKPGGKPHELLADSNKLRPSKKIARVFDSDLGEEVIHVLVRLPEREEARLMEECIEAASRKQKMMKQLARLQREEDKLKRIEEHEARIPEKRKRAWEELNDALLEGQGDLKKRSFSSMEYSALPERYQPREVESGDFFEMMKDPPAINDKALDELTKTIEMKKRVYSIPAEDSNEATRVQFMGGVFEHVVCLYQAERNTKRMKLGVQVKLDGERVKAHGVVDFLVTEGKKNICVVEAKHWDFMQGDVQGVLGMEVAVEKNEEEVMYGIVTNYTQWHFLKRTDDGIEMMKDAINARKPLREELQSVASRVYAILNAL